MTRYEEKIYSDLDILEIAKNSLEYLKSLDLEQYSERTQIDLQVAIIVHEFYINKHTS